MTMTRDELIRRIEAGETGAEIDVAIAKIAIPDCVHVPPYTTSIDAAVTLLAGCGWYVTEHGRAVVWRGPIGRRHEARIPNKPAAALVAAWLKATA